MTQIDGCITIDVGDWSDDLTISADCEDIVDIMLHNDITIHELLEHFDVPINVDMNSVIGFIAADAHAHHLQEIITLTARKMRSDYLDVAGRLKRLEDNQ
jgi:hypothetical protein